MTRFKRLTQRMMAGKNSWKNIFVGFLLIQIMGVSCFAQEENEYELHLFTSSPLELKETSEKFESAHPELDYKIVYNAPNAIFVIGSCGTIHDMKRLKKEMILEYPNSKIRKCSSPKTE